MQNHQPADRLSWGDSVFLNLERGGMPLNVAGVSILEGQITFKTFLAFVESKLPLIPRYLQRVTTAPLNLGLPLWDYDPHFDIRNHLREVTLKRGSDAELKALAGEILSQVMNREHPLWDMTLVHGLKGDRTALIARMHHCLADGIGGVGIMSLLMDASPVMPRLSRRRPRLQIPPPRNAMKALSDALTSSYSALMDRILSTCTDVMSITERAVVNGENLTDEFSRLLPEIAAPTERLFFNVIYRGPQKFTWTEIPLATVKKIGRSCETSVNDVLLALVTATIRRYSELRGDRVKGRLLRIMVPVNVRGNDNPSPLGNRISLIPVTIPLDIRSPKRLLAAVHRRTAFLKRAHAAELVSLAGGLFGVIPGPMQALAGPLISQLPITPFNMVCTNVPGPQFPLYLLGHKMLHWYPYVPVGGELALNCAILSYNGAVYIGFSADIHVAPDLGRLERFLQQSFRELRTAVAVKAPPKKRLRARKDVSSEATTMSTSVVPVSTPFSDALPSSESTTISEPKVNETTVKPTGRFRSAGGSI
jgi:diacylglycerol O-acyltransferase / wax synthase